MGYFQMDEEKQRILQKFRLNLHALQNIRIKLSKSKNTGLAQMEKYSHLSTDFNSISLPV